MSLQTVQPLHPANRIKLDRPLRVDGRLDEAIYANVPPITGFIQTVPNEGRPSTERTEAWVSFDENYIYVSGKCYDSAPPEQWTANEMRRDTNQLRQNDHFGALLDTFHDKRTGGWFEINPVGGRMDGQITGERQVNLDWNPIWDLQTGRFDGGWIVEMAIPLKTLRYNAGDGQVWGLQIRRSIRHKNEWDYLTRVPRILAGPQALNRISAGGTLVGLDLPKAGGNVELKPYARSEERRVGKECRSRWSPYH